MKPIRQMDPEELGSEALRLLGMIVAEFESDPMSVQCFDLRVIVEPSKALIAEQKRRNKSSVFYGL